MSLSIEIWSNSQGEVPFVRVQIRVTSRNGGSHALMTRAR
jgi:hypothetical protein